MKTCNICLAPSSEDELNRCSHCGCDACTGCVEWIAVEEVGEVMCVECSAKQAYREFFADEIDDISAEIGDAGKLMDWGW